jgi:hypothetical protein
VTPAEAGAVLLEEPDWDYEFQSRINLDDEAPEMEVDRAFEEVLREYRRFHCTGEAPNRDPMPVVPALIALAKFGIMPPRHRGRDVPRGQGCHQEQVDDHVWLVNERAWRIIAIEARTLFLDSFGELKQIDMNAVNWDKYVEARCALFT